jgi:hypothetical protein
MSNSDLPLKSLTIGELYNGANATYEVPIYQRNYAWKKEEIATLIQDVYDSMIHRKENYYIGTLVSFHKGGNVFEVIDGQQRLTTLNLILKALGIPLNNQLTYRARKKSNDSIRSIPHFNIDQKDAGIVDGFQSAEASLKEIVPVHDTANFCSYFLNKVHIIHYQVPRDVDLNHYFEIMNSRGEQLEKHEIVKARLIEKLSSDEDKNTFHQLWEFCSQMNVYIQQKYDDPNIFGKNYCTFEPKEFGDLPPVTAAAASDQKTVSIKDILTASSAEKTENTAHEIDAFQPILDFSNFLLIVLKITRISDPNDASFDPMKFTLDDKSLLNEFDELGELTEDFVRQFGYNLLKAKFLLDNYVVHHSNEEDTLDNNPWKLQHWYKEEKSAYLKNSGGKDEAQFKLVHLLSMFEVSFTARQRKNYLFYCLFYFFRQENIQCINVDNYCNFVLRLADKYLKDVYLNPENLNDINVPKPGSFDATLLVKDESGIWKIDEQIRNTHLDFNAVFGDGSAITKGIPLFVFNYLDYAIWHRYFEDLRGDPAKNDEVVSAFFERMGCTKFDLNMFHHFYFSRTRRSLEHYFPQANANGVNGVPTQEQINCFGNYAMIGSDVNSSASNWTPRVKRDHYLDASGKIRQVSVASLKFLIMLQQCKDNADLRDAGKEWLFQDIQVHQRLMVDLLLNSIKRTHHQTPN